MFVSIIPGIFRGAFPPSPRNFKNGNLSPLKFSSKNYPDYLCICVYFFYFFSPFILGNRWYSPQEWIDLALQEELQNVSVYNPFFIWVIYYTAQSSFLMFIITSQIYSVMKPNTLPSTCDHFWCCKIQLWLHTYCMRTWCSGFRMASAAISSYIFPTSLSSSDIVKSWVKVCCD